MLATMSASSMEGFWEALERYGREDLHCCSSVMYVGVGGDTFLALPVNVPILCNMAAGKFTMRPQWQQKGKVSADG
jgi:hypothetical protein